MTQNHIMTIPNYPTPDPSWDYVGVWYSCHQAKQKLEETIKYMADIEDETPESDRHLKEQLSALIISVNSALY